MTRFSETDALLFILGEEDDDAQATLNDMLPGELERLAAAAHKLTEMAIATSREKLRQEAIENNTPCDRGYPLGGMRPRTDWCTLLLHHKEMHLGVEGHRFSTSGSVKREAASGVVPA